MSCRVITGKTGPRDTDFCRSLKSSGKCQKRHSFVRKAVPDLSVQIRTRNNKLYKRRKQLHRSLRRNKQDFSGKYSDKGSELSIMEIAARYGGLQDFL